MTRTNTVPPLTAAILAGGEGSRFGGADKGFLLLHGKPLIERMLMRLEPQADHVVISANRNLEAYARYGHPVICDQGTGFEGPLAGICATLQAACTEWVLFAPVDAVQLPDSYAQHMCTAAHQNGSSPVVVHDGVSIIPVACLIHRSLRPDLDAAWASGQRSMRDWLRKHQAIEVRFDKHPRSCWSVNTPAELQALEKN